MPWLEEHPTSGRFKISFRWAGKKVRKTVRARSRADADAILKRFEETLDLVQRGRIEVPPDCPDIGAFLLSDGKVVPKPPSAAEPPPKAVALREVVDRYLAVHANGAMEKNSLATAKVHLEHFARSLRPSFAVQGLTPTDLQCHLDGRTRRRGKKPVPVSPVTLRKEMATFRACWNWAVKNGLLKGVFPSSGLVYPKTDEKPPFQTRSEIERQVARGGLSESEIAALWDCLYLTVAEVEETLRVAAAPGRPAFFSPMLCTAAYTGVRRSELLRIRVEDVSCETRTLLIREKKRARGQRTTRRVPIPVPLEAILKDWLTRHPGGPVLFCQEVEVVRSKKRRAAPTEVTRNEAHDHFQRAFADTRWACLRGWHVYRHSFASNCAGKGVDQRLINEWMGHQTEEMVRRYRHLLPDQQRAAIDRVFVA